MPALQMRISTSPIRFVHHRHKPCVANAGVADENIHIADFLESGFDCRFACHIAADGFRAGFGGYSLGGIVILLVKKTDPVSPLGKQFHSSRANTPGAAGNYHI